MADSLISDPDREARLEDLMRLYGDTLVRMCCLYLHDAALVQDAAQETFVKAWRASTANAHG